MRFTAPLALLLLLALPAFAWLGWPARGASGSREKLSLVLRLLIALCLVFGLAGLELVRPSRDLAVVFLVDGSDSMPAEAKSAALDYINQALARMAPDDQAAVVVFGGDALVERPMTPSRALSRLASLPQTNATDLNNAIRLGLALFPPDSVRRMVLLSDGVDTVSPASLPASARLAAANGVQIEVVPFSKPPGPEALVTSVDAPAGLHEGEKFDLHLAVQSSEPMSATLRVINDGQIVYQAAHLLQRGTQSLSLPLTAGKPGFTNYMVQLEPQRDNLYQNNQLATFAEVEGPPRVMVVAPPPGEPLPGSGQNTVRQPEAAQLVQALQSANYAVQLVPPSGLPSELSGLAQYASLVLVDVPARDLSPRQMSTVQSYVRDLGGGLLAVGGPTSYGVGGYFRTPLEETLPVEMQIKNEKRRPSLSMIFIIDHSGSMSETSGGATKLELAKEAALRSVDLLFPTDRVGVIAFDETASWVVPMTDLSNPDAVKNAIASIRSGGGTDILAGLQAMAKVLPQDPANLKHVILLTDGGADPTGIPELVTKLNKENGITLTAVGVGQDAAPYLSQIAQLGGGRYYFASDPGTIPRIFTEETSLATRSYIEEHPFFPQQSNPSPILSGINEVPKLQGYVGTSPKSTAQTILVSDLGDPILAAWQYGLGKAVAFTSDATSRWAQNWVPWQGFPTFWSQAVDYTLRSRSASPLEVNVEHSGMQAQLVVNAQQENGTYLNNYTLKANLILPDGKVQALTLQQTAPGRYQAPFNPTQEGAYLIGITGEPPPGVAPTDQAVNETAGWVLSYSPEYRDLSSNPAGLEQIASLTGGANLQNKPDEVFTHNLAAATATRPVWPWLLALAALLLPFDIAVRRLALSPAEVQRGVVKGFARLRRLGSERGTATPVPRPQHMQALFEAKQRADEPPLPAGGPAMIYSTPPSVPDLSLQSQPAVSPEPDGQEIYEPTPEVLSGQPIPQSPEATTTTAASLLEAKRKRRQNRE